MASGANMPKSMSAIWMANWIDVVLMIVASNPGDDIWILQNLIKQLFSHHGFSYSLWCVIIENLLNRMVRGENYIFIAGIS